MIKKLTNNIKPVHMISAIVFCLSIIALFFIYELKVGGVLVFQHITVSDPFNFNLTASNLVLSVLNISMLGIVFAPLTNEDERVKTIRSYAAKGTFRVTIILAILIGLLIKSGINLLVFAAIMQAYYFIVFRICLYRDSAIIYLNEDQVKAYYKGFQKQYCAFILILSLFSGLPMLFAFNYHRPDLLGVFIVLFVGASSLVQIFYTHWKN